MSALVVNETDKQILKLMARGEILDADGNAVPPVLVLQDGDKYEVHTFVLDMFGELVEVEA